MHLLGWLVFYLVTSAISYAVKRYIASRQKGLNEAPQNLPPVAAGTPIPVLYGTQRLRPIPVWDGGEKLTPIKKQGQEIAKNHLERYQGLLCWDEASVVNMVFGDNPRLTTTRLKPTYFVDGADRPVFSMTDFLDIFHGGYGLIEIWAPDIFGEFDGCGGHIYIHTGSGQGVPDPIIESVVGAGNVPDYRDMMYVVFDYFRMGMDRSRPIDFVLTRYGGTVPRTIDADAAAVAQGWRPWNHQDARIPDVIRDLMIDDRYGLGFDPTEIDHGNFDDVARLTDGGFGHGSIEVTGVSIALAGNQNEAKATIDECLRVLNAILVRDPESNKYQLKMIRDEAPTPEAFAALRSFDHKQIRKCKVTTREWSETINEVTIEWTNPAKMYEMDLVVVRNDASIAAIGYRPQKMSFRSVTDYDLAVRIGIRELKAGSLRIERQTLKMTREAADLVQGDVFRATYNKCGYQDRVLRVLAVNLGSAWSGEVTVETIDDVFSHDGGGIRVLEPGTSRPQPRMPTITETSKEIVGVGVGRGHVTLLDEEHRVYEIAYRARSGANQDFSDWVVLDTATPNTGAAGFPFIDPVTDQDFNGERTFDVPLSYDGPAEIEYRYKYIGYGTVAAPFDDSGELTGTFEFSALAALPQIKWAPKLDPTNGKISVEFYGLNVPVYSPTVITGYYLKRFEVWKDNESTHASFDIEEGHTVPPALDGPPWITPWLDSEIAGFIPQGTSSIIHIAVVALRTVSGDEVTFYDDTAVYRSPAQQSGLAFQIDGGGTEVAPGGKCSFPFSFAAQLTGWRVTSEVAATMHFDIWKNNSNSALPDVSDSLGLSFGSGTDRQVTEGVFGTPIDVNIGDNVTVAVLDNNNSLNVTVTLFMIVKPVSGDPTL
jgi:hypothetical protein